MKLCCYRLSDMAQFISLPDHQWMPCNIHIGDIQLAVPDNQDDVYTIDWSDYRQFLALSTKTINQKMTCNCTIKWYLSAELSIIDVYFLYAGRWLAVSITAWDPYLGLFHYCTIFFNQLGLPARKWERGIMYKSVRAACFYRMTPAICIVWFLFQCVCESSFQCYVTLILHH